MAEPDQESKSITRRGFLKVIGGAIASGKLLDLVSSQTRPIQPHPDLPAPTPTSPSRPTLVPVEKQLSATAKAVRSKDVTTSFVEDGPFTWKLFNEEIRPNIYIITYSTDPKPNYDFSNLVLGTGWFIKTQDNAHRYLCTSSHGLMKTLPAQVTLRNSSANNKETLSRIIPLGAVVDPISDQTIFRILKEENQDSKSHYREGFIYEDNIDLVSQPAVVGVFGFPYEFHGTNGINPILEATIIHEEQTKPLSFPQNAYLFQALADPGSSGSVVLTIDSQTGKPKAIGIVPVSVEVKDTSGNIVEAGSGMSALKIDRMLKQMPQGKEIKIFVSE